MSLLQQNYEVRQSVWLGGITRYLLDGDRFRNLLNEGVASGLVFNSMAFEWAVKNCETYDTAIQQRLGSDAIGEALFFEISIEDARQAADLLRPIYDQTDGVDGWVSLDVSPRAFYDPTDLAKAVKALYERVGRPNIMIKVPGTKEGLIAVKEAVSGGVPINITHLFSGEQFSAAAAAYLEGIEQRILAGSDPNIGSVASLSLSPWGAERKGILPAAPHNSLGIAILQHTYRRWRERLYSPRWESVYLEGARPLQLLWSGVETDLSARLRALGAGPPGAPFTVFKIFEPPPKESAGARMASTSLSADEKDGNSAIARLAESNVNLDDLAETFQKDAVSFFVKKWFDLITAVAAKSAALTQLRP